MYITFLKSLTILSGVLYYYNFCLVPRRRLASLPGEKGRSGQQLQGGLALSLTVHRRATQPGPSRGQGRGKHHTVPAMWPLAQQAGLADGNTAQLGSTGIRGTLVRS